MSSHTHTQKIRQARLLSLAVFAAGSAATIALFQLANLPPLGTFLLLVVIAGTILLSLRPWWRKLDHMQKDSHYISWYWGGTFGAAVAVLGLASFIGNQSPEMMGAVILLITQLVTTLLYWIWWSLRHRGDER